MLPVLGVLAGIRWETVSAAPNPHISQHSVAGGAQILLDSANDCTWALEVAGVRWASLPRPQLHASGAWQMLELVNITNASGTDKVGPFTSTSCQWQVAATSGFPDSTTTWLSGVVMVTSVRHYGPGLYLLEQSFPQGAQETATGSESIPVACWPSLNLTADRMESLGYLAAHHIFGGIVNGTGLNGYPGDTQGGAPMVLFDQQAVGIGGWPSEDVAVVLSPASSFKVAVQSTPAAGPCTGCWAAGLNGMVTEIPVGFTVATVLASGRTIHDAMEKWGSVLLTLGDKSPPPPSRTASHLSYWTDNGAFYYYHLDHFNDYAATMLNVAAAHVAEGLPVASYQLDSWWYSKYLYFDGGLTLWEPKKVLWPHGLEQFHNATGKPLTLHNRWFSSHTEYAEMFPFEKEGDIAIPSGDLATNTALFDYLMRFQDDWGLEVYEQDWLTGQFERMNITKSNVTIAETWLAGMGAAALARNIQIQYCMPLPSDFLQSTTLPAVSQIRVSNDYESEPFRQWRIGKSSMFAWAVGLRPFKDVFRTSLWQRDNVYILPEPNAELQVLVATLSTGPVAFGDKINTTNKTILLRCCALDGAVLAPSRPATAIELTYVPGSEPSGEIWTTVSKVATSASATDAEIIGAHVFAAGLAEPFSLQPQHAGLGADVIGYDWVVLNWTGVGLDLSSVGAPRLWTNQSTLRFGPLAMLKDDIVPFEHWVANPVLPGGWILVGEVGKFVPLSPARFTWVNSTRSVPAGSAGLVASVRGTAGERLGLVFTQVSGGGVAALHSAVCVIPTSQTIIVAMQASPMAAFCCSANPSGPLAGNPLCIPSL